MKKNIIAVIAAAFVAAGCSQTAPAQTDATSAEQTVIETEESGAAQETSAEEVTSSETQTETQTETEVQEVQTESEQVEDPRSYLDLNAFGWDTDFAAFTSVQAFKCTDGVTADLDGDGADETIEFRPNDSEEAKPYTDYENTGILPLTPYLIADGTETEIEVETVMNDDASFALFDKYSISTPSGLMYLCDIDAADGRQEIAFVPFTYTDDYCTMFISYHDGKFHYAGAVDYDTPDAQKENWEQQGIGDMNITWGRPLIVDGSGAVSGAVRGTFQTWFGYTQYAVDPDTGVLRELANSEIWPYTYADKDDYDAVWERVKRNWSMAEGEDDCMLLQDITVYDRPSEDGESHIMTAGAAVPTGECHVSDGRFVNEVSWDNWEDVYKDLWIYVTSKDGDHGWYHAYPYVSPDELFSVRTEYD
ncbi:MAG: hypothetical protein IJ251_08125 [Oscillospiraceae bacterium]|nr:hypothetical protein [Oscillospiraceae bacterium]